ncbi:MAG: 16S rRNA (adenine(1518)-N(6)/adenine(1519)-N(6))-dimethyltransferase RsmA [Candidatus Omnitrophica bacterium]|nr:16S rRNA (adenine(1518)-N(6)/adenine(1519)-N(6))-dimethyltransferase RsmA [Candidatus Omnitrophota bacterium]
MKQTRALSQIFLKDTSYIERIAQTVNIEEQTVLEIGAGDGAITSHFLEKGKFLYCVEIDRRFSEILRKTFKDSTKIEIINADILKISLERFGNKVVVVGNTPYLISNELIRYLVKNRAFITRAYLTFQKEFVDKLIAESSTKNYSFISCYAQYYARLEKLFDIPAQAFSPKPKVDSSFLSIEFYQKPLFAVPDDNFLFCLIRRAFSQRRKKIINSLPQLKNQGQLLESLGISANARAENISLNQYATLANALSKPH